MRNFLSFNILIKKICSIVVIPNKLTQEIEDGYVGSLLLG